MNIVVASGKGGTGKTTVATNLAHTFALGTTPTSYCDCDVEAPNGHIFLKPTIEHKRSICTKIPSVNMDLCDACGKCGETCKFSAIVVIRKKVLTYPELCHSCGGCGLVCPNNAISEIDREIGILETGKSGGLNYVAGKLNIGEASAVPLISQVKQELVPENINIIDAPPGTSCPVIETVRDADYVILVTEATPFGLNDLILAVETVRKIGLPFSVVINRYDVGDNKVEEYCQKEEIDIMARIPYSREIAEAYSRGQMLIDSIPEQRELYSLVAESVVKFVDNGVAV